MGVFMSVGTYIVSSGVHVAGRGALGFFGASALHLGAAATIGTVVTAASAGFLGGVLLYCPVIALRTLMHRQGMLAKKYYLAWVALDMMSVSLALPVGAYMLGLAVQPFLICAALVLALHLLLHGAHAAYKQKTGLHDSMYKSFAATFYSTGLRDVKPSEDPGITTIATLGTFC